MPLRKSAEYSRQAGFWQYSGCAILSSMNNAVRRFIAILSVLALFAPLFAVELNSSRGFYLDLPEGFAITQSDGSSKFSFSNQQGTVLVDILIYAPATYASVDEFSGKITAKLQAKIQDAWNFDYAGRKCRILLAQFTNNLQGYVLCIDSLDSAKLPEGEQNFDFLLLAYTQTALFKSAEPLLASVVDAFSLRQSERYKPGPLLTAKQTRTKPLLVAKTTQFAGMDVSASYDKNLAVLAQELVEREYKVLSMYAGSPALIEDAVYRFYRQTYRAAYPALLPLAIAFSQAWERANPGGTTGTAQAEVQSSVKPHFGVPGNPEGYTRALLAWVQNFTYVRNPSGSDVVNPITAGFEQTGDCDSRVLVMAILLAYEHIDSILMISLVHEHALIGVALDAKGAKFPYNNASWLIGETTAHVELGLIDQTQSGIEDWFGIDFQ